ncbi:DUF1127 domain-containing protein [Rhizobium sp. S163]|nr:DUF1127 domain-containing protein [Rhizobium sp. S163]MDM9645932.1 DUF1127 domain-containing protein [Rhizobium sp. S163]
MQNTACSLSNCRRFYLTVEPGRTSSRELDDRGVDRSGIRAVARASAVL